MQKHCHHCGVKLIDEFDSFCHSCGKKLKKLEKEAVQVIHKYHLVRDAVFLIAGIVLIYFIVGLYNKPASVQPEVKLDVPLQPSVQPIVINQPPPVNNLPEESGEESNNEMQTIQERLTDEAPLIKSNIITISSPGGATGRRFLDVYPEALQVNYRDTISVKSLHWDTWRGLNLIVDEFIEDPKLGYGTWNHIDTERIYPGEVKYFKIVRPTKIIIKNNEWRYYDKTILINVAPEPTYS